MKKILITISFLILVSCGNNGENIEEKNNENLENKNEKTALIKPTLNDKNNLEDEKRKKEIREKIEKYREIIKKRREKKAFELEDNEEKIEIPEEKLLNIKFYSQAINGNFEEPYENFCEEASFLNGYYFLTSQKPNLKEYDKNLMKIKELEDLLLDGGYRHTSLEDTLKIILAFQGDNVEVFGEIIENPNIEIIKENIVKGNPVLAPVYGKGLNNNLFLDGGPTYHNLLIKGYDSQNFITNEVGISKGNSYKYEQNLLMENIFNYDKDLYPTRFKQGKKEVLILYKK